MRLLPTTRREDTSNIEEETSLWSHVRRAAGQPAPKAGPAAELRQLSDAYRHAAEEEEARTAADSQASFGSIHERLMQAVAASQPLNQQRGPRRLFTRRGERRRLSARSLSRQGACAALVVLCAVWVGRQSAENGAPLVPVAQMVADYDRTAGATSGEFEIVSPDPKAVNTLSRRAGMKVLVPSPHKVGATLVGMRESEFSGVKTVESHYEQAGSRLVLFQARALHHGLDAFDEARVGPHVYLVRELSDCRVVVWRNSDSVLAFVSRYDRDKAIQVADLMRQSSTEEAA